MSTDDNKKLPVPPWADASSGIEPKYPYVYGERDNNGGHTLKYRSLKEPEKASSEELSPSGSYKTVQYDENKKEIITRLNPGETRTYTSGGTSSHIDGHDDISIKSTQRTTVDGDIGVQTGKDYLIGVHDTYIEAVKDKATGVMGGSESKTYNTSEGDVVQEHSGNYHEAFEKDRVTSVAKNSILMVKDGDHAIHVQSGNFDTHIAQKGRIYADSDILIESKSKITLKVGQSVIIITPDNISIIADRVDLNP